MRKILLIALIAIVCNTTVRAQTLADRVPAGAIAYVGWKGADSADNGYAGSHLQAVVDSSGFAQLRDQLVPQLMQKITAQSNDHGESALVAKTALGILWRHPTAAFFGGMTKDPTGAPEPKLGVICQAGAETDALMTIFNGAVHGPDAPPMSRAVAAGDCTAILIGYDRDDVIPAAGDSGKSLMADADFARLATAEMGRDPIISLYLDVAAGFAMIDQNIANSGDEDAKTMWPKARDASGLTGIKHVAYGAGFEGKDWQTSEFVDAPSPRSGLLTVIEPAPIDPALLARIPSTSTMAAVSQFNIGLLLTQARSITVAVNPDAGALFDKGMGFVQMMVGRNLQRDIFGPLGSQWAAYSDASIPAPTSTAPVSSTQPAVQVGNLIVVNKPVDAARALQGWTALSFAITNISAGYIQNHQLPITMGMNKSGDDSIFTIVTPYFQPSWTIKDGFMYFGMSPDGAIAAASKPASAPITQQPGFVNLAKALGAPADFTEFQYADLPASVPQTYPATLAAVEQLRQMAGSDLVRIETDGSRPAGAPASTQPITIPEHLLPSLEKLLPELSPALSLSWADATGWHRRSRAPFPLASPQSDEVTIGATALGISILLPALNRGRETANRVKCASNERQIGQACLLFANDHRGAYPASIADMLTAGDITPDVFICPSSGTSLPANHATMTPEELGKWLTDNGDYVYVGKGMTTAIGADQVVVYEKPEDHKAGMNILFGDGHVEFDLMPQAVKMIQDQNKTVPNVKLPEGQ